MLPRRLILSESTDVYFNLALEDYLLHETESDVLMLWQSHGAVVCGKHQNLCAEVNYGFCLRNGIKMARRLSGGGTVYHDSGNVNFTFIQSVPEGLDHAINFKRFLDPVIDALKNAGVQAEYSGRNDLLLNGKKISGNAEHLYQKKKRVLHHGTLLFDSHLGHLRDALHSTGTYIDKAVKSVRSEVTNLKPFLPDIEKTEQFISDLTGYFLSTEKYQHLPLTEYEIAAAAKLSEEKYSTSEWLLGYSPRYRVEKVVIGNKIAYSVQKGLITEIELNNKVMPLVEPLPLTTDSFKAVCHMHGLKIDGDALPDLF